ncbi:hypothetical protein A2164_03555 [Candidatus Curtissbacteria bacterium RBG_13_35_7]|uniref:NIF system FeS cluster assembly NifU N-terminal domain-containing protein n=1 Tax=Candidatus Curtissbacteria bacterium RBG_13_35_7 TaxID=1797705 RepID=A0A1F5G4H5_9BACT|nr:MAG: hypothetical protein A2164_03555 [Candidatus Curtissbacteria bacterium RBG_13_35_7]
MMDLYREEILEHWRNPNNFGKLNNADLVIRQVNSLCGDEVRFYIKLSQKPKVKSQKQIVDVRFEGVGCAISIASSSILSEKIKGKSIKEINKLTSEKVLDLVGGKISPARLKCVLLPLEAIKKLKIKY